MAELEKVKRDKINYKAFASLEDSTKKTLAMAYSTISAINEGGSKEEEE
jgi:hypothetical protein